jgi:hypothetical protein
MGRHRVTDHNSAPRSHSPPSPAATFASCQSDPRRSEGGTDRRNSAKGFHRIRPSSRSTCFSDAGKRFLACNICQKCAKNTLFRASIACLTALLGNSLQTYALIGSISRFHSPFKGSISRYLSRRIATAQANICGARRTT